MSFEVSVDAELADIKATLLEKNRKYGNSALEPARVFSKAGPIEQLLVRIDDKISRIQSGQADDNEDAVRDLIGYLVLLRIARRPSVTAQRPAVAGIGCAGVYPDPPLTGIASQKAPRQEVSLLDSSKPFRAGNLSIGRWLTESLFGAGAEWTCKQGASRGLDCMLLHDSAGYLLAKIVKPETENQNIYKRVWVVDPGGGACLAYDCEEVQQALERIAERRKSKGTA